MLRYITILIILSFSFCLERPSGHSISGDTKTALWGSISTVANDFGGSLYQNIGFDFSLSEIVEISINLSKSFGQQRKNETESFTINFWIHESLTIFSKKEYGNNIIDDPQFGVKHFSDNYWMAYAIILNDDYDLQDGLWSLGKLWESKSGLIFDLSYHFESKNTDKGMLQFTLGKTL